jgi:hypothetical protein
MRRSAPTIYWNCFPSQMREVPPFGIEAARWTVVFHRQAENRFFSMIALGHFKHVSALAWIPELSQWWVYDVGFRRTRLKVLVDGPSAQSIIAAIVTGNATVTIEVRDDNLPWMRLGLFCTTAVSHLIGVRCGALRPDALFRHLVAQGGVVRDDGPIQCAPDSCRSEPCGRTGAGAENLDRRPSIAGAG